MTKEQLLEKISVLEDENLKLKKENSRLATMLARPTAGRNKDEEKRQEVESMLLKGYTIRQIADSVPCSTATVQSVKRDIFTRIESLTELHKQIHSLLDEPVKYFFQDGKPCIRWRLTNGKEEWYHYDETDNGGKGGWY